MDNICTCGRDYIHCRMCGKKNPYLKTKDSMKVSFELGQKVNVRKCQTCGFDTHELMECKAPTVQQPEWHPGAPKPVRENPKDNRPQFTLTPKTWPYAQAASEEYNNRAASMKFKTGLDILTSMLKDGWEDWQKWEFNPDYSFKGFTDGVEEPIREEPQAEETELTLDQIIEKMKEEQK